MKTILGIAAAASLCAFASGAHAAAVTLDFDGLDGGTDFVHIERPANFYSGGLGSMGSGPGPDYGITFLPIDATSTEPRAICNLTFNCAAGGNSLFIFGDEQNGKEHGAILRIEGGFRGIFEFDAAIAAGSGADVIVRTSLNNPSTFQVGWIKNPDPSDTCGRLECAFRHYTIDLADHILGQDEFVAYDIMFYTFQTDAVFVDNIHFHDLVLPDAGTPIAVPEPSSAAMIGGIGLIGAMLRRRRAVPSRMALIGDRAM